MKEFEALDKEFGDRYPMKWDTPVGSKIIFVGKEQGDDYDIESARKDLEYRRVYTVRAISAGGFHTSVWLEEVFGAVFNSVQFANVEEETIQEFTPNGLPHYKRKRNV